jgi:hypothetical protein
MQQTATGCYRTQPKIEEASLVAPPPRGTKVRFVINRLGFVCHIFAVLQAPAA